MKYYIISLVAQLLILLAYFKLAAYFNIVDRPNNRSSHKQATIRGGGIIFPLAAVLWYIILGNEYLIIIGALLLLSVISFYDDIRSLSFKKRILFHAVAATVLLWQLQIFSLPLLGIVFIVFLTVAWINAFNFMDGINGIMATYSLVALVTLTYLNSTVNFISQDLLIFIIIAVLLFSFFNTRKTAVTFAGDVGSISMAFLLAWFTISLVQKTQHIEYVLLFLVYGIDTAFTIIYRLQRKENVFVAHRTHLYQYLSNELKWSHLLVASLYATVQLAVNVVTILLISTEKMTITIFIIILLCMSILYIVFRYKVTSAIRPQLY